MNFTNVSFFFFHTDLISNQSVLDLVVKTSYKKRRTHFSADQKSLLEAMFGRNRFPSGDEIATMAAQLEVGISKVQVTL